MSYIGRRVGRPGLVLASGVLYTLGRMLVYIALGWLLTYSLLSVSSVSMNLQHYISEAPLHRGDRLLAVGWCTISLAIIES